MSRKLCLIVAVLALAGCGEHFRAGYYASGIRFEFETYEIVRPRHKVDQFVQDEIQPFEDHWSDKAVESALREDWIVRVTEDRPNPGLHFYGRKPPCGYTNEGTESSVWHKGLLDSGCGGYEIKLQLLYYLRGDYGEKSDVRYMRRHDLL